MAGQIWPRESFNLDDPLDFQMVCVYVRVWCKLIVELTSTHCLIQSVVMFTI